MPVDFLQKEIFVDDYVVFTTRDRETFEIAKVIGVKGDELTVEYESNILKNRLIHGIIPAHQTIKLSKKDIFIHCL
jgi:hypothetical protein